MNLEEFAVCLFLESDDVHSQGAVPVVGLKILEDHVAKSRLLPSTIPFRSVPAEIGSFGLDLAKDEGRAVQKDQVGLSVSSPVIGFQQLVAKILKILSCGRLSTLP